jgi:hypothetical protein
MELNKPWCICFFIVLQLLDGLLLESFGTHGWSIPTSHSDKAKIITAKFKNLRGVLKSWQAQLSNLKTNISNVMLVLAFFGILEEFRDLSVPEWNFGALLMDKLSSLSQQ